METEKIEKMNKRTRELVKLLGEDKSDEEISMIFGVSLKRIAIIRGFLGIYKGRSKNRKVIGLDKWYKLTPKSRKINFPVRFSEEFSEYMIIGDNKKKYIIEFR